MKCEDVKSMWNNYILGKCTPQEEEAIEKHIAECPHCEAILTKELENQSELDSNKHEGKNPNIINDLPLPKQKRIINRAKWKNRIINAFTAIFLVILLTFASSIFTTSYYGWGEDNSKLITTQQVVRTTTQMTMPNVYVSSTGSTVNTFFTMNVKGHFKKTLGRQSKAIGQYDGTRFFNQLKLSRDWSNGHYDVQLFFQHPEFANKQPASEKQIYKEQLKETWNTLTILPEGTVSELAISFDDLYTFDEVYSLLNDYDFKIVWYAVNTGVEAKQEDPYLGALDSILGLHEHAVFDFMKNGMGIIAENGDGEKRAEVFLEGLSFLVNHKDLANSVNWMLEEKGSLEERYKFVEENGVKLYGVVVTGPTKELLKLQENEHIIFATVGEVDYWNWTNPSAIETIYN